MAREKLKEFFHFLEMFQDSEKPNENCSPGKCRPATFTSRVLKKKKSLKYNQDMDISKIKWELSIGS